MLCHFEHILVQIRIDVKDQIIGCDQFVYLFQVVNESGTQVTRYRTIMGESRNHSQNVGRSNLIEYSSVCKIMNYKVDWVQVMESLSELGVNRTADRGTCSFGTNILLW